MDNISQYIIPQLKRPVANREYRAISNIIGMLSNQELCVLYDDIANITAYSGVYDWDVIHKALRRIRYVKWNRDGGNKTIAELVKQYKDTGSNMAADEMCDRFAYQSVQDQELIFKTLIRTDHLLGLYPYLNDTWGRILVDDIKQLWVEGVTDIGLEYVIKFADEKFIWDHLDELSSYNYALVAMRLGNSPDFVIDQSRFHNKWIYYSVQKHLGRDIGREQLLEELFQTIKQYITSPRVSIGLVEQELEICGDKDYISVKVIPDIDNAIIEFCAMGLRDEILFFYEWDATIRHMVNERLDEQCADTQCMPSIEDMWLLYCKIARHNFPKKYAYMVAEDPRHIERRNEMMAELKPLIEKFGFEIEDDADDFSHCSDELQTRSYFSTSTLDDAPF